jgi:sugar phosphate permease
MSLVLSVRPPQKNAGKKMLLSIAAFGCCMISFAFSKTFLTAWIFLFLSGVFDEVSVIIRSTIVQLYAPENMRGRVEAVSKIFIGSSNELGAFESGLAARFFGLVPSIVAGGCITLMVSLFAWMKLHEIRELDTSNDPEDN